MDKKVVMNAEQQLALDKIVKERKNVFVSGAGGTGKSTVIQAVKDNLDNVIVCAPTGMAAMNVGGETIHSTFKLPCRVLGPNEAFDKMLTKEIRNADVIIIDEISMVRSDCFSSIIKIIKIAEELRKRKKQIIVFGDFWQLPPVITTNDRNVISEAWERETLNGFCFETEEWKQCNFEYVELQKNVRQENDYEYQHALDLLRVGSHECIDYFNTYSSKQPVRGVTLCGRKTRVDAINRKESAKISRPAKEYYAIIDGNFPQNKKMTEDCLELKEGMRVMTICNDKDKQYRNGSLGTIEELYEDSVVVRIDGGYPTRIVPYTWVAGRPKYEDGKITEVYEGSFTQLPLRVAYASTIHKVQGMTLGCANIDPDVFESGMLYVAMGRCRSIKDIHLMEPISEDVIYSSNKVKEFYDELQKNRC